MAGLRHPRTAIGRRVFLTLAVISALRRAGCRVLEANAHADPPLVRVDRQPSCVDSYGFRSPPPGCVRVPVLCTAMRWGTRIEWINTETHQ